MSADRLRPGLLAALGAGVLGLATGESTFMILALVPLAYGVFGYLSGAPEPSLRVERSVSDTEPRPGDDVTVTLAVENTGDRPLADLRVADDPPNGVPVDGPTRSGRGRRPRSRTTAASRGGPSSSARRSPEPGPWPAPSPRRPRSRRRGPTR